MISVQWSNRTAKFNRALAADIKALKKAHPTYRVVITKPRGTAVQFVVPVSAKTDQQIFNLQESILRQVTALRLPGSPPLASGAVEGLMLGTQTDAVGNVSILASWNGTALSQAQFDGVRKLMAKVARKPLSQVRVNKN